MALPFFEADTNSGLIAPTISLQFGSAGSDSPFGGVVDAVADLLGGGADNWRSHLVSLALRRTLAPEVDLLSVTLARSPNGPAVTLQDAGTVDLADTRVFSGTIVSKHSTANAIVLTAGNGSQQLALQRINQVHQNKSAGDVVADLCAAFGVDHEDNHTSSEMPRYVVDDARSVYAHIARLAGMNNAVVWFDGDGGLHLQDADSGEQTRTFTYGIDILSFQLTERAPATVGVDVVGEGAAGEAGSEASLWLRKDPAAMRVATSTDTPQRFYRDARLRSQEAVSARAQTIALNQQRAASRSELLVTGAAEVTPGSLITLSGLPDGFDGDYFVREVTHQFDARQGFRSRLKVARRGSASALGGLLGAVGGLL